MGGRDHLADLHIDEKVILKWPLKNGIKFMWLRVVISGRFFEQNN
jgi:hypothetical protein